MHIPYVQTIILPTLYPLSSQTCIIHYVYTDKNILDESY